MSRLDELLKKHCPSGVEYKKVKDIAKILRGKRLTKDQLSAEYAYPVFHGGLEPLGFYMEKNREANTVMVINVGASAGTVGFCEKDFWSSDGCFCISKNPYVNPRFLYYVLTIQERYLMSKVRRAGIPTLDSKIIEELKIPVPPIEVQNEIVKVLDDYKKAVEELANEITAELAARKKQYKYYCDSVLTFGDDVPMVKLADIATDIYRGAGIKRDEVKADGIPCVRYGEIYTSYDISFTECISHTSEDVVASPKYFEHGDIIFTITGESVEGIAKSIAYLGNEKCMAGGDTVVMKHKQEPRYISYALSTTAAQAQKSKGKVKSKVVHSSVPALKEIEIPLPDMETQKRIADLLDNFHKLCNDISAGLPAEIEARQKQYEYYRDKLLNFKEMSV